MMYKHWKKIVLAVTAFFWNACDNSTSPTASQITPDSSSGTNIEPTSSSAAQPVSSEAEESRSSSAANATSSATKEPVSSVTAKSSSSAAVEENSSSSVTGKMSSSSVRAKSSSSSVKAKSSSSSVTAKSSSSSVTAKSSSSSVKERFSSSSLDQNVDLYGCPSDICGQEPSSSSVGSSSSSPIFERFSSGIDVVPLYGVLNETCTRAEGDSTFKCTGGVTCVESVTENTQIPSCSGDQICAKYGVVIIKEKTYKCSDGKVYNEAEFKARYNMLTFVSKEGKKIPCYRRGDSVECDDGEAFSIDTDDKGNKIYVNEFAKLSEKEFLKTYEVLDMQPALYGPPCMFNGTCDEEK